jgi:hypothetical protein
MEHTFPSAETVKGVMKMGNKSHKKAYRSAPSTDVTGRNKSN